MNSVSRIGLGLLLVITFCQSVEAERVQLLMPEGSAGLVLGGQPTSNIGSFDIQINAGPTLAGNAPALAAFNRAAAQWEARIADSITVNVDADMANMGSTTIIGSASTVTLAGGYTMMRDAMVADAADEPDDGIVGSLPTFAQAGFILPAGFGLTGNLSGAKSSLKALGFTGLDTTFGATDSSITFNTQFNFDFDNSDGVLPGHMDFETIAAHELGHALGFLSEVDYVDYVLNLPGNQTADISPSLLDMFRFEDDDPSNASEFTTGFRQLTPGGAPFTDFVDAPWGLLSTDEILMSTGAYTGDGRQASHWKDSLGLGLMDPTASYGEVVPVSESDFRAMDVIGYDIASVPEPGQLAMLLGLAAVGLYRRRRQR